MDHTGAVAVRYRGHAYWVEFQGHRRGEPWNLPDEVDCIWREGRRWPVWECYSPVTNEPKRMGRKMLAVAKLAEAKLLELYPEQPLESVLESAEPPPGLGWPLEPSREA